jgi:hypothetical protein
LFQLGFIKASIGQFILWAQALRPYIGKLLTVGAHGVRPYQITTSRFTFKLNRQKNLEKL